MIGLYYLVLVPAVWIGLTWGLWKLWRFSRQKADRNRRWVDTAFSVIAVTWLAASFWYGGGRKFYYDAEVKRLCAIDGGIKVYETVTLPPETSEQYVNKIPSKSNMKETDEYYYVTESTYLRRGDPRIRRIYTALIRRKDEKILGESIFYSRGGGDMPGPAHPSGFGCPKSGSILKQVFNSSIRYPNI